VNTSDKVPMRENTSRRDISLIRSLQALIEDYEVRNIESVIPYEPSILSFVSYMVKGSL